jgi:Zn-dependent alcohol dehydrogenase
MGLLPMETEGLVVEESHAGFRRMPVTLDNMRPDEVLVEMKYSGICHTVSAFHKQWNFVFVSSF